VASQARREILGGCQRSRAARDRAPV